MTVSVLVQTVAGGRGSVVKGVGGRVVVERRSDRDRNVGTVHIMFVEDERTTGGGHVVLVGVVLLGDRDA